MSYCRNLPFLWKQIMLLDSSTIGPPANASTYEVKWALVHAAESISAEWLSDILPLDSDTEVKISLINYYKNQA